MFSCWLQLEYNMQGDMHVNTMIVFSIVEIKILFETMWPVVHFNQGEKTDKFGKSIWRKYGQWLIMAKERDQTSLESLSFIFLALSSL